MRLRFPPCRLIAHAVCGGCGGWRPTKSSSSRHKRVYWWQGRIRSAAQAAGVSDFQSGCQYCWLSCESTPPPSSIYDNAPMVMCAEAPEQPPLTNGGLFYNLNCVILPLGGYREVKACCLRKCFVQVQHNTLRPGQRTLGRREIE